MAHYVLRAASVATLIGAALINTGCGGLAEALIGTSGDPSFKLSQKDESLTPAGYVELGMPSVNRDWGTTEKGEALGVIAKIVRTKPSQLPHVDGPGAPVMAKLRADLDEAIKPSHLPSELRDRKLMPAFFYEVLLLRMYLEAHYVTGMYDDELTQFTSRVLKVSTTLLDSQARTMVAGHPLLYTDPSAEVKQLREGVKSLCVNTSKLAGAREFFGPDARRRFNTDLIAAFPRLMPEIDPLTRQEIRVALRKGIEGETDPTIRKQLEQLTAIAGAAPAPSQIDIALVKRPRSANAGSWATHTAADLDLTADFPGQPVERKTAFSVAGAPGQFASAWVQTNDNIRFTALRMSNPDLPGSHATGPDLDEATRAFDAKATLSKRDLKHSNVFPAREIAVRGDAIGVYRFILVGDDLVELAVEMPANTDIAVVRKHAERFFASVKINPPAPKPATPGKSTV
jgi:hypothetical protein